MELYEYKAHQLQKMLAQKEISSVELTKAVLNRLREKEEDVEAYITVTEEIALAQANASDQKRMAGEKMGPLAGIPFAVKDNICTKDIRTTCGSHILEPYYPPYQATAFAKMQKEGAVLLGKTNMDEFGMGSSTETSYYKKTKNPCSLDRVPGGSSGGSAAAVAAQEAIFALGSDTGGSIRQPASFCGVVGIKPTYGLVSRFGLVAFASSFDQIGPLGQDVQDCATVLTALAGKDEKDETTVESGGKDYTKALTNGIRGMRVGLPKEYFGPGISEEVKAAVLKAAKVLEYLGANVEELSLPDTEYALPAYYLISSAEASSNLARYDGIRYGFRAENCKDLQDVYFKTRSEGFGDEVKRRIMLGTFALSAGYYDAYYGRAQKARVQIRNQYQKAFGQYDLLLTPVSPMTAWKFGEKSANPLEMYTADICTVGVNIAGLCAISLPCGQDKDGLPIGAQIIGPPLGEEKIIQAAYALEKALEGGGK